MVNDPVLLEMDRPCEEAVSTVTECLCMANLSIVRTFDLQVARKALVSCPCPHHGTGKCDCQMVVLLVYQAGRQPLTLVAHGSNGHTWFSVVDTPQQRADPRLEALLKRLVISRLVHQFTTENTVDNIYPEE